MEHKHSFPCTEGCAQFHLARARLLIALLCEGQSLRGVHADVMLRVIARELDTVATALVGKQVSSPHSRQHQDALPTRHCGVAKSTPIRNVRIVCGAYRTLIITDVWLNMA